MKGAQRAFFETKSFDARSAKQCGPALMKSDGYRLIGQCGHEGECRCQDTWHKGKNPAQHSFQ